MSFTGALRLFALFICVVCAVLEIVLSQDYHKTLFVVLSVSILALIMLGMKCRLSDLLLCSFLIKFFFVSVLFVLFSQSSIVDRLGKDEAVPPLILVVAIYTLFLVKVFSYVGRPYGILTYKVNYDYSTMYAHVFLVLGVAFQLLHGVYKPVVVEGMERGGFGGFGNFVAIGYLGMVFYIYSMKSVGKLVIDLGLVVYVLLFLIISVAFNTKHQIVTLLIAVGFSVMAFSLKVTKSQVLIFLAVLVFLICFVFPVIHATRTYEYRVADVDGRLSIIVDNLSSQQEKDVPIHDEYALVSNPLLDRLDMLEETVMVVSGVERSGFVGALPVLRGLQSVLPSFLISERSNASASDEIMWHIQEKSNGLISRTTIGLVSSVYAMYGWKGFVIIFPLSMFGFVYVLILLFGNRLKDNVLAVFMLANYILYFSEKNIAGYIQLMLRDLPLIVVVMLTVNAFIKFFSGKLRL